MPHRILVAGSINMDVVTRTQNHPRAGETVMGHELHFLPGGKGSNQAVAASRLNGDVSLVGKLGKDAFGDTMLAFLKQEKLNLDYLTFSETTPTGTAIIVLNAASENTIVVVPGSNGEVNLDEVERVEVDAQTLVVAQFEIPQESTHRLFNRVRSAGGITVLNPAPAAEFYPGLQELVDYLVVNETELAYFSGNAHVSENVEEISAQARQLQASPEQCIIITRGRQGSVCLHGDTLVEVPGLAVEAVDTTGAGDCFVGALSVALAEGRPVAEALDFANRAAAISVQRLGASSSMPYRHELT